MKKFFKSHPNYKKSKKIFLNYRELVISLEAENRILNGHKEKKRKYKNSNELFDAQERQMLYDEIVKEIEITEARIKDISQKIENIKKSFDEQTIQAMEDFSKLDVKVDSNLKNKSIDAFVKIGIWVGSFLTYLIVNLIFAILTGFTLGYLFIFPNS